VRLEVRADALKTSARAACAASHPPQRDRLGSHAAVRPQAAANHGRDGCRAIAWFAEDGADIGRPGSLCTSGRCRGRHHRGCGARAPPPPRREFIRDGTSTELAPSGVGPSRRFAAVVSPTPTHEALAYRSPQSTEGETEPGPLSRPTRRPQPRPRATLLASESGVAKSIRQNFQTPNPRPTEGDPPQRRSRLEQNGPGRGNSGPFCSR
jgi:hypothetical protein